LNGYATMGEFLLSLSKYFVLYNGDRPHQALGNKTADAVYQSASKAGAMIVDKYRVKVALPLAFCCSGTAFRKDSLEKTLGIEFKNRGSADQLHET
jgi:putative transposase